eukprot:1881705-Pyramimonas_sp.AAC.1
MLVARHSKWNPAVWRLIASMTPGLGCISYVLSLQWASWTTSFISSGVIQMVSLHYHFFFGPSSACSNW